MRNVNKLNMAQAPMTAMLCPRAARLASSWALIGALAASVAGCIVTDSEFAEVTGRVHSASGESSKNPQDVLILEGSDAGRPYAVIGVVRATARSLNLVSSEPTRANVNDELRAKAAKIGADAIVKVRYAADRQGLQARGFLTGEGQAVVWIQSQR